MALEVKQLVIKSSINNQGSAGQTNQGDCCLSRQSMDEQEKDELMNNILARVEEYCDRAVERVIKNRWER
jgi:hypothetical protein